MKIRRVTSLLFLILIITTTYLMLTPHPPQVEKDIPYIDKIEHAAAFLILSFLLVYSVSGKKNSRIGRLFLAVIILGSYGILMEILQKYTGRNFEIEDIAADIVGVLIGSVLSFFFCD